jgi:hypothetical protein
MKKIHLYILFFFAFSFSVVFRANGEPVPRENRVVVDEDTKNMCGINAMYACLKHFGAGNVSLKNINSYFENTEKEITLSTIREYLEGRGYFGCFLEMKKEDISDLPIGVVAFEFQESNYKEKISHTRLYIRGKHKTWLIDYPLPLCELKDIEDANQKTFLLVISREKNLLSIDGNINSPVGILIKSVLLILLLLLSIFLYRHLKKEGRK